MSNNKQSSIDIESIAQRIQAEFEKHSKTIPDWYRMAAIKIHNEHLINRLWNTKYLNRF